MSNATEYTPLNSLGTSDMIQEMEHITSYDPQDNDIMSSFFQTLRSIGGMVVTAMCLPCGCCGMGPIVQVPEGYRAAVLSFGKLKYIKPPGTYAINVGREEYKLVCIQLQTQSIPNQTVITSDGITTAVDAVCFYRIVDITKAIFSVANYDAAVQNLAQYTLEVVLGKHTLDELLKDRDSITKTITDTIATQCSAWGIKIEGLEIRDIKISSELTRVMASKAEAMREGEAKVIAAEAELRAAGAYKQAADELDKAPGAMNLRWQQTLVTIGADKNTMIVVPGEIMNYFNKK